MDQPLKTIFVKGDDLDLRPEDFAQLWVLSKFCGVEAVLIYAELRARGFGSLDSFASAFPNVIGRGESLAAAAAAFEGSRWYKIEFEEACERIGADQLYVEWERRAQEIAGYTATYAQAARIALHKRGGVDAEEVKRAERPDNRDNVEYRKLRDAREREEQKAASERAGFGYVPFNPSRDRF